MLYIGINHWGTSRDLSPLDRRFALIAAPTAVHGLPRLGEELGLRALYVKREDQTAAPYGGNKVRNLEYLFAAARAQGADRVVTIAPLGSNFVAALAAHAPRAGLAAEVHHFVAAASPQIARHALFSAAHGARLSVHGRRLSKYAGAALAGAAALDDRLKSGSKAYFIAPGGSSVVGALGHVRAALELAAQVRAGACPEPDVLVVGAGTCGTMAGLTVGLRLAGLRTRLVGIRCVDALVCNRRAIARLANAVARHLGVAGGVRAADIGLRDPPGHGIEYGRRHAGAEAMAATMLRNGLRVDTTYTMKVAHALREMAAEGGRGLGTVLYWHTYNGFPLRPLA